MDSPSAATSSAHPPQHLDRRNEPAPQVAAYNNSEMRQKIIEILASTANGCLAELGYFPGMPHKLKELEAQNKKWQTENVKLFEDNKRLMGMLHLQNESLKWVKIPDMEKIQRIKDLEQENQALKTEREELSRRSMAEGDQPPQQGQMSYAQLQYEHSNLLGSYRLAYNEVQRLRAFIGQNPQLHVQGPIRIEKYHSTPLQILPQHPTPVATQMQVPAHQIQAPHRTTSSPVTNPLMLHPTVQRSRHDPAQTQNAAVQRKQQQPVPIPRRSTSGTIIIPPRPPQPPAQSPSQPPSRSMTMQEGPSVTMTNNVGSSTRNYSNILPAQPTQPSPSGSSFNSPVGVMSSAPSPSIESPLSGQPINAQFHPPPMDSPSMHPPLPVQNPSTISPRPVLPTPPTSAEFSVASMTPRVSPHLGHSPGLTSQPTSAIASVASNLPNAVQTTTPIPPATSLKRDSTSEQGIAGSTEEPNKKPRLEHSHQGPVPTDPIAVPPSVSSQAPPTEVPAPTSEVQEAMQIDAGDEAEDSGDELIEVGPDGLRLVKDCLTEIFHEPREEDGAVVCKLCEYRHAHGYQEEPPLQFVNLTDEELEDHCMTEHEAAWANLRNPNAE